jgi:beta-glucosidase
LKLKNDLGLFENPYKDGDEEKEKAIVGCKEHRELARKMAAASFVLLKNEAVLPLKKDGADKLAFIGPYVDNVEMYGSWSFPAKPENTVTVKTGVSEKNQNVFFAPGSYLQDVEQCTRYGGKQEQTDEEAERMLKEAVELAGKADTVVLCLGEHRDHSGEAGSRACICIPRNQMKLLNAVYEVNQNIITLLFSGRPLEVKEIAEKSKAVLMTWMPGTEGGNAIADVLFGDVMPQGKLSMCLPRTVAQAPIYYNKFRTGRPNHTGTRVGFVNGYIDESTKPLYPFGYCLTYTTFAYSPICLDKEILKKGETLIAKATVTNTGSMEGTETVQLYVQDVVGSVVRPVKMLR